jgi:enoyl-CoA hydratase/carnithine racemase
MTDFLLVDRAAPGIATLTFNRPDALNALNLVTMTAFLKTIEALRADADLRVVILTGAGEKAFCSGGDLRELSQYPDEESARSFITTMGDALLVLERLPVPVIAAINGYALGGGSEIALACDMRIVDENVRFGLVQVKNALTPGWGAGQRLLRVVGYARAMQILLQGNAMSASEILALGLANQVTPAGKALEVAQALAQEISTLPPDVVRGIKALLQAGIQQPYDVALATERAIFPPLWAAEPHLQAVERFLNRKT